MPGSNTRMSAPLDQSAPRMDRRLSNSSDTSLPDNSNFRQLSTENTDYIPTRVTKVAAAKPAANPLQFIKVGPCNLYKSAQETLKKVEEVKKITQEERQEEEDWQSNLDNWKCSRRKRQEHIIERVVEVKKLELEEHDRNRRRSKTFNEMMEDRNGRGRKVSLVLYKDDDANDFSDLGIGTSSGKSSISEDYMNDDCHSVASDRDEMDKTNCDNHNGGERNGRQRKNGINGNHDDNDTFTTATGSSPEPEEYTYERAIQSYVNFAETRVKSRAVSNKNIGGSEEELEDTKMSSNNSSFEKLNNASHNGKYKYPPVARRDSAPKIEARLAALEQRRRSSTDLSALDSKKIPLPKVDVLKRRELFEKASLNNEPVCNKPNKSPRRVSGDLTTSKSIKDRLSHLEKQNDDATNEDMKSNKARKLSGEVTFTLKERMSTLGKSTENVNGKEATVTRHRLSNGDLSPTRSVRERLSNLEKQTNEVEMNGQTETRRMSLDTASSIKDVVVGGESDCSTKQADVPMTEPKQEQQDKVAVASERCSSPEEEVIYQTTRQQFHRSLDSLDVEASSDICNEAFERVQSLEDLDCCGNARNYPASASSIEMLVFSSQSGDTDREDSGIHTADVSCSVSQADEPVEDGEIVATMSSIVPHIETDGNGANTYHLEVQLVNHKRQESGICESLSPVNETEMTTAFLNVDGSDVSSIESVPTNAEHLGDDQSPQCEAADDHGDATESEPALYTYNQTPKDMLTASKALETQSSAPGNYFDSESISNMESQTERIKEQQRSDTGNDTFISEVTYHSNEDGSSVPGQVGEEIKEAEEDVQLSELVKNKLNVQCKELSVESPPHYGIVENDADKMGIYYTMNENQIPALNLSSDTEIVAGLNFPLGPPSASEPPKEKPPPPPMDLSDDDLPPRTTSLKRLDSTKRIKKEIRRKRSDFLGIEGNNDDNYLEPELKLAPPPDMTTYLVEEQRSEQQLYRQSICSETDSNLGETTESRDSGVELDRGHPDDLWSGKQTLSPDLSSQHSRQNSELYGNASTTSEEDEITKKEREIIEILEKEEQWRYGNNSTLEQNDIGEKLALKLRQLEQEKLRLEWERAEEENRRQAEMILRREEEQRLRTMEQQLRQQENNTVEQQSSLSREQEAGEALRAERERLQRESEELMRQKENLLLRESQQMHRGYLQEQQLQWNSAINLHHHQQQWDNDGPLPTHLSLQDISAPGNGTVPYRVPQSCPTPQATPHNYRLSLPDLQQDLQIPTQNPRTSPVRRPPPPIPPAKPLKVVSQEQRERENSIRNSRMPSADIQHADGNQCHQPYVQPGQQMSRQTLQALSAAPRSRLISTDTWMQAKRKPEAQRNGSRDNSSYNYQHWLIQEAEHRRITEQQQRNATSPRKSSPPQHHPHHQQWNQSQMRPDKPLPDSIIQTLTQRVQNRVGLTDKNSPVRRRLDDVAGREPQVPVPSPAGHMPGPMVGNPQSIGNGDSQEKMLSVSGKKKCSHCGEELGRGAAMIIESLRLFYHIECFKCCVCHVQLGDGLMGTDVRVRNNKLHCHNCYSSDDGVKFSCV